MKAMLTGGCERSDRSGRGHIYSKALATSEGERPFAGSAATIQPARELGSKRVGLATLVSHASAHPMPDWRANVMSAFGTGVAELTFDEVVVVVGSRVAARWAVLQLVGAGRLTLEGEGPLFGSVTLRRVPAGRPA